MRKVTTGENGDFETVRLYGLGNWHLIGIDGH